MIIGAKLQAAVSLGLMLATTCFGVVACGADRGTIGALIAQTPDKRLVLREVPENLASARAGLRPGDEILLIDGRDVRELDDRGVHRALGGSVGDPVKLTIVRGSAVLRVTLRRTPPPKGGRVKTGGGLTAARRRPDGGEMLAQRALPRGKIRARVRADFS